MIYAVYVMLVSMGVLSFAFGWLYHYDRHAQREHEQWLADMERQRPIPRLWD